MRTICTLRTCILFFLAFWPLINRIDIFTTLGLRHSAEDQTKLRIVEQTNKRLEKINRNLTLEKSFPIKYKQNPIRRRVQPSVRPLSILHHFCE